MKTPPLIGPRSQAKTWRKLDGRGVIARQMAALEKSLAEHVGGEPNVIQRQLIKRAARLSIQLELLDQRALRGEPLPDHASREYIAFSNALRLVLRDLGLERRAPAGPTLHEALTGGKR